MKIELLLIGKTSYPYISEGMDVYGKRLAKYFPFSVEILESPKQWSNLPPEQLKEKEGEMVLKRLTTDDFLVMLDEKGKEFTSEQFAAQMEKWLNQSKKRMVFLVGGAFGFSPAMYARADAKLALSKMTFSHQMIRIFVLEQIYRGMSILHNEPYHNS